jgi:hypothetical protein
LSEHRAAPISPFFDKNDDFRKIAVDWGGDIEANDDFVESR